MSRGFRLFKWGVYSLLLANVYLFLAHATAAEAVDQVGWLLLLAAFELETGAAVRVPPRWLHALRWAAYAVVLLAVGSYVAGRMWPDLLNTTAWLLVCAALEWDVRAPAERGSAPWHWRRVGKAALYLTLLSCAVWWGARGELLDFYDAALWLLCFVVIELNLLAPQPLDPTPGNSSTKYS